MLGRRVGFFASCALTLACGARPAAVATPAASSPRVAVSPGPVAPLERAAPPSAPRVLARDLVWPWLIGNDRQYVYWLSHEPDPEAGPGYRTYSASLMRVAKIGGLSQLLIDGVMSEGGCDVASDADAIFVAGAGNHTTHAILTVRARGASVEQPQVFREGVDVCHMLATRGRLFWAEAGPREEPIFSAGADPNDAPHASLHSANLDGSDERVLWKGQDLLAPEALLDDGASLVLVLSVAPRQYLLGGLGTLSEAADLGREDTQAAPAKPAPSSMVLRVGSAGGAPRVLWTNVGKLRFAGTQGPNLLLCADDGLYRLPLEPPASALRVRDGDCRGRFRVWNDWALTGPSDIPRPAGLIAERLVSPTKRVVFDAVSPGEPLGFTVDADGLYTCRHGSEQTEGHCDLLRTDVHWLDARDAAPAP